MRAAVLSIGTELTRGELVNGNAAWLGEELTTLGFDVVEHVTVDDDEERIMEALLRLRTRVNVVISTGGLGPTSDDRTTAAAARAFGVGLARDEESLEKIRRKWRALGQPMPVANEKQADFPVGAEILPNPAGTAPGFTLEREGARLFFLPGVPVEMREIFERSVIPAVAPLAERTTHQVHVRTFGRTESQIADQLRPLEAELEGISFAYRASFPEIEIKVLARGANESDAEALARHAAERVRAELGDVAYGEREDSFAGAVGRALRERGLTLAVAESCTGGLIGELVTSVAGSSDYMLMDAVTYSNSSKSKVLGVNEDLLRAHGAVSEEVAAAMAEGALRISQADIAVSVTGIAGPGGGSEDKPVGTVFFALARKDAPTITKAKRFPGDRQRVRTLSAYVALRLVERAARGKI